MCLFCYAKNVLLLWNIHLSNSHRLLLLFSFCAKQCRNEYSFSLQWKLITPLWILPRHYTSQHLKSRASKISGPFGMHSSLFHLNHLAFQCSNSPCQVSTCCLHHWQHYSFEQGHSCAQKDFISFPWNQGYPCCRRLLLQWLSSRKVPRGGGGAFQANIPSWNFCRYQRWHSPCWLTLLINPAHQAPKNKHNLKENQTQKRDLQWQDSHPPPFPFFCYPEQVAGIRGL